MRTRVLIGVVSLVVTAASAAACGRDSAFAQTLRDRSVKGRYVYAGAGKTASVPWRFAAGLQLDGHGKYSLDVDVSVKGEGDKDRDFGTYRVDGDRLLLRGDGKGDSEHELIIRGDSLIADTDFAGSVVLRMVGVPKPIFVKSR